MHRVEGGPALEAFPASTKVSADGAMISQLFDAGRASAQEWLQHHYAALGRRSTVDIRRDYLDDTRLELPLPARSMPRSVGRGFRPWLQRMLRQWKG
jgi:hypothetical protein